jgi:hypothetical protein
MPPIDFSKSLQDLDGQDWGEPTYPSNLVVECHRLRRVPISELSGGDLRMLIGQQIGLEFLVPRALELLADDPLVEGDYYAGDLLQMLLMVPADFWAAHDAWRAALRSIAVAARIRADEIDAQTKVNCGLTPSVAPSVVQAIDRFLAE